MIYLIGQVRWTLHEVSYIVSNCHELSFTNGFKLDWSFTNPL